MICVLKGLRLRVIAAIISAILFYSALTFMASTPAQTLAAEGLRRMPAPRKMVTKTVTAKTTIAKPYVEVPKAYEGLVEEKPVSEYRVFIQNLLISAAIALTIMAIFKLRMR